MQQERVIFKLIQKGSFLVKLKFVLCPHSYASSPPCVAFDQRGKVLGTGDKVWPSSPFSASCRQGSPTFPQYARYLHNGNRDATKIIENIHISKMTIHIGRGQLAGSTSSSWKPCTLLFPQQCGASSSRPLTQLSP